MGGWRLEVARMALYITFPVAMFYYFNQPELFEEWVVKTRKEMYPPVNSPENIELLKAVKRLQAEQEEARLNELERG